MAQATACARRGHTPRPQARPFSQLTGATSPPNPNGHQHAAPQLQDAVCFPSSWATYTATHEYLHLLTVVSKSEVASCGDEVSSAGRTRGGILTSFFPFQLSDLRSSVTALAPCFPHFALSVTAPISDFFTLVATSCCRHVRSPRPGLSEVSTRPVHVCACFRDFFSKKQRNPFFLILKHENQKCS